MSKSLAVSIVLISTIIAVIAAIPFGLAEIGTNVSGIVSSNTTWNQAGSPYILTGNLGVKEGVILTIEQGVTVNINNYFIQVNGTLNARGSSSNPINFNGGRIIFTATSQNWTEDKNSGSIIENANINSAIQTFSSPKITASKVYSILMIEGSPLITNNVLKADVSVLLGSPLISGNEVINCQIKTYLGRAAGYLPIISSNRITGGGIACYGGNGYGGYVNITGNIVSGCQIGILGGDAVIEGNYINNNELGVEILNGIIRNNTILNNSIGIKISKQTAYFFGYGELNVTPIIAYNNIIGNSNTSIHSTVSKNDIDATNNWWGTTDANAIDQSIYDSKNDFTLGTVNYSPFLSEANLEAPTINMPIATPTTTSTVPELYWLAIVPLLFAMFVVAVILRHRKTANLSK